MENPDPVWLLGYANVDLDPHIQKNVNPDPALMKFWRNKFGFDFKNLIICWPYILALQILVAFFLLEAKQVSDPV